MKKIDKFTKEEVEQIFAESKSQDSVARRIGYNSNSGSSHSTLKKYAKENNIDVSHFTGQGQNKGKVDLTRFRKGVPFSVQHRKNLLSIRPHKCECCGNAEQLGHEIPLEVHHVDGDRLNNELENLQLLCPNCHAQTDNYCGRNIRYKEKQISDDDLLNALRVSPNIKQALAKVGINYSAKSQYEKSYRLMQENNIEFSKQEKIRQKTPKKKITLHQELRRCASCGKLLNAKTNGDLCGQCYKFSEEHHKVDWPSKEELLNDILTMPIIKVGEKYGVSDNTIRKWCKRYELPHKHSDIKKMRASNDSA